MLNAADCQRHAWLVCKLVLPVSRPWSVPCERRLSSDRSMRNHNIVIFHLIGVPTDHAPSMLVRSAWLPSRLHLQFSSHPHLHFSVAQAPDPAATNPGQTSSTSPPAPAPPPPASPSSAPPSFPPTSSTTLSLPQPLVVSPASAATPPPPASPSPTPPSPDGATTTPRWRDRVHPAGPRCVFCFYLGARGRRAGAQGLHPGPRRGCGSAARNMATLLRGQIALCPLPPPGSYGSRCGSCTDRWPLPAATALGSQPASAASVSLIFICPSLVLPKVYLAAVFE